MLYPLLNLVRLRFISLLSCAIAMLFSPGAVALWGSDCKPATSPKPYWIDHPGRLPGGYAYGVGYADFQQDSQKHLEQAVLNAKTDLAGNIESMVWAEYQRETTIKGKQHSSHSESYQKSSSTVTIPGIKPQQSWMGKDCRLYVLVAIPEATRRLLSQKALMEQYQARAQDAHAAIPERLKAIDSAIDITTRNDFTQLPNSLGSQHLLSQHCQLRRQVASLSSSQRIGLFWIGSDAPETDINAYLIPALTPQAPGIAYYGHCNGLSDCLNIAQQQGIQQALVAYSQLNFQRKSSHYQGLFQLRLELYDTASGDRRFVTSTHHRQANILQRQPQMMHKGVGVQKWLEQHPTALQGLSSVSATQTMHEPAACAQVAMAR